MGTKEKKKKQFKSPNAYLVIFGFIVFSAILTWIIPGGEYALDEAGNAIAGTYQTVASNPQGLWDVFMSPLIGMVGGDGISGAIAISLAIMLFGGFLEVMDASGALKIYLKRVAMSTQKNYHILIWVLVYIMGALGTTQGSYEEGFVFLLIFLPIILSLGLDTMVAVMIVALGTQAGCLASIINPFATGIAAGIAGVSVGNGILVRCILFVLILSLVSLYICRYADKVKADPTKSPQYFRLEEDRAKFSSGNDDGNAAPTKAQKRTIIIFILYFIIMVLGCIPWTSLNENFTFFYTLKDFIVGIPVLGKVIGTSITPFGDWYFNEIGLLAIFASIAVCAVCKIDVNTGIDTFIKGCASVVSTALIVPVARGIQVIMTNGMITPTILHFGETSLASLPLVLFLIICMIFYLVLASFMPSSTGLAAATMSIMAPLARFAGVDESVMIHIYNIALGIAKMIMPTSIVVMTCTSMCGISYIQWVKTNWKAVATFLVVSLAVVIVSAVI